MHRFDSIYRCIAVTELLSITKGNGVFHVIFETVSIWLSVSYHIMIKYLCFHQFNTLNDAAKVSDLATRMINSYL